MRAVSRMFGSRWQILASLILISSMGYYIFYYFQENQKLAFELTGLTSKFKRCMIVSSKYEKKYKTSHSNEQLFAQSNRDLQRNLANEEKQLLDISSQLDKEKEKLTEAYLFYTHMKDLFGVSGQLQNSFEKKVEPVVVNTLKEKISQWKSDEENHERLKKNYTQLLKKHIELNNAHESLHNSNRRLQKVNVKNLNKFSNLKKMYGNLQINYKNLTNMYSLQLSIDNKLQNQINTYNFTQRQTNEGKRKHKKVKGVKGIAIKLRGNEVAGDRIINLGKNKTKVVVKENNTTNIAKLHEGSMIKKTNTIVKLTKDKASVLANHIKDNISVITNYKPSANLKGDKQVNISKRMVDFVHTKKNMSSSNNNKTISLVSLMPIKTPFVRSHKNMNVDVKPNKISTPSFHQSTKKLLRLIKTSNLLQNKTTNTSKNTDNLQTVPTLMKSKTTMVHPTVNYTEVTMHNKSDEVEEYLERENENHGDFDEEQKYDPPHIKDVLDENGLSERGTAD